MTDQGIDDLRKGVQAIALNLPAILVQGEWLEWTGGPVAAAIDAAYEVMRGDEEIDIAGGDMDTPDSTPPTTPACSSASRWRTRCAVRLPCATDCEAGDEARGRNEENDDAS